MGYANPYSTGAPQLDGTRKAGYTNPFDSGPETPDSDGGGGFWSHLPNLGGITAAKQLISGFTALPGIVSHPSRWDDFGRGLLTSVENLAATATKPLGVPGTDWSVADKIIEPLGQRLDVALGGDYNGRTEGNKPMDLYEMARAEGPIAALVNQVSTAAMFAAPVAGVLGSSLKGAISASAEAAAAAEAAVGTAAEAGLAAEAATAAARVASIQGKLHAAEVVAHPYRTVGAKVGELARGSQTVLDAKAAAGVADEVRSPSQILGEEQQASRDALVAAHYERFPDTLAAALDNPVAAAAAHMTDDAASLFAEAGAGIPPGHTRFSRVGGEGTMFVEGEANPSRASGTTMQDMGRRHVVDVPDDVAATLPRGPNGEVEIPPEYNPMETTRRDYNADREQAATEADRAADAAGLKGDKAAARKAAKEAEGPAPLGLTDAGELDALAHVDDKADLANQVAELQGGKRVSHKEAILRELIKKPAPSWALRAANALPDYINRKLAILAKPLDKARVHVLARDYARYVEVAQRMARTSDAVKTSSEAAGVVMQALPGLKAKAASRIVGEEIGAQMDGTAFLRAAVEEVGDVSPELQESLSRIAMRKYKGLSKEQRAALGPDRAAEFDAHIQTAADAWRVQKEATLDTLLSSSKGSQGLKDILLGKDSPAMTPDQLRRYRDAMSEIRRSDWVMRRHPAQLEKMAAEDAKASLLGEAADAETVAARELLGQEERAAAKLGEGTAKGVRPENIMHSVSEILDGTMHGVMNGTRYTYDVGLGRAVQQTTGHLVAVAEQWAPMTLEEFRVNGPAAIRQALENPLGSEGTVIGQGAWAGRDARFTVHLGDDGLVHGDITMSSWKGKELSPAQARSLGETYGQGSIYNAATGEKVRLSQSPMIQNLHAQYVEQTLDHASNLNRVRRTLEDAFVKSGGTAEDADTAMRGYMMWDHSLSRANPEAHKLGDYFKKLSPKAGARAVDPMEHLTQTVLGLDTKTGFQKAMAYRDTKKVATMLAWYYDSHDVIEKMWRHNPDGSVKMMRMLNGVERPAAEVFYDLIAVTSVMASPTQNFGRALMALANMDKFIGARKAGYAVAEKLLKELDAMQPEIMRVENLGKPTEIISPILKDAEGKALPDQPGTRLSNKFLEARVRKMLEKTSMTNDPKYKVFDVLRGDLDLSAARNADVAVQPEWWGARGKPIKLENLPVASLLAEADRLGIAGPAIERLRELHATHGVYEEEWKNPTGITKAKPVTASEFGNRGNRQVSWADNRKVSPKEYMDLQGKGQARLDDFAAHVTPIAEGEGIHSPAFASELYDAVQEDWGGGTYDSHTGRRYPVGDEPGTTDQFAVTVRPPKTRTIEVPIGSTREQFAKIYAEALQKFGPVLEQDGAAIGVFHDIRDGVHHIEIDPVHIADDIPAVEELSAATHAEGGAFQFSSMDGYFGVHVEDAFKSRTGKGGLSEALKAAKEEMVAQMSHADLDTAAEGALMEHAGSTALAKLRSFRDNLANPDESLAVTLDSVMAQMYGFKSTDWDINGVYAKHAAEIRELAEANGLKPHQVQALLWVYTKETTGNQDFGRLHAHAIDSKPMFDYFQDEVNAGALDVQEALHFDPLEDYWHEEVDYQDAGLKARQEIKRLKKQQRALQRRKLDLSPDEAEDLAYYEEQVAADRAAPRSTDVKVAQTHMPTAEELATKLDEQSGYEPHILPDDYEPFNTDDAGNALPGERKAGDVVDDDRGYEFQRLKTALNDPDAAYGNEGRVEHTMTQELYFDIPEFRDLFNEDGSPTADFTPQNLKEIHKKIDAKVKKWSKVQPDGTPHEVSYMWGQLKDDLEQYERLVEDTRMERPHATEVRREIHGSSQDAAASNGRRAKYYNEVLPEIRESLANGDVEGARRRLDQYLAKQRSGIVGDEGAAFHTVVKNTLDDGPSSSTPEGSTAYQAMQHFTNEKGPVPRPNTDLLQTFGDKVRGALRTLPDKDGRLVMRLFEGADLQTLFHEGAHLLRQILPQEHLWTMEMNYPGILDKTMTTARRAAEERFVGDLMYYMRGADRNVHAPSGMSEAFDKIGATLEDQWAAQQDTHVLNQDVTKFWDDMFLPELQRPNQLVDPVSQQAVIPAGVETKRFRWESEAEFAKRARQYGEARERVRQQKRNVAAAERRAGKANDAAARMHALLSDGKTAAVEEADKLRGHAHQTLDKLAKELDKPTLSQVPAQWQPLWEAVMNLHGEALLNDGLADVLSEIPETFSEVLRFAAEKGFEPTHVQDLTWEQASRSLFDHVTLGRREETAATRKARTGGLSKAGLADRSIEALAAGLVQATHEVYTNKLVGFIEENYAVQHPQGVEIPDGWTAWSKERAFILTGERSTDNATIASANTHIIPDGVAAALESMSKNYDHWAYRGITRVTSPWRTLVLTMSPKWYINNFVGNVMLATVEGGFRPRTWLKAYRQWRHDGIPKDVPTNSGVFSMLENESTVLHRGINDARKNEGYKAAWTQTKHKIARMNEAVDEIARAYVYDVHLAKGHSREHALTRAHEAMVDYGDLSPFERSAVRAIVPFYAWQKGIFKLVSHFPNDHPLAAGLAMQLGALHKEMMEDKLGGSIPDAYLGLTDIKGLGVINTRAFNPFQDSTQMLTPQGLGNSFNPFVKIFMQMALPKPAPGTTVAGLGATGGMEQRVDPAKALGNLGASLPQVRLGQQAFGDDVYGQDPSTAGMVGSFLGEPRGYDEAQIAQIADRVTQGQEDSDMLNAGAQEFSKLFWPDGTPKKKKKPGYASPFG